MADQPLRLRPATVHDAAEIARLCTELGHPATPEAIAQRWPTFHNNGNLALVAPGAAGSLLGLVTIHTMDALHRAGPVGRITTLVVDARVRRSGIGRALVAAAEQDLRARGCIMIEVTSNLKRSDAHAFYERLGYDRTSYRFAKTISAH
jgi:ribosomal protein S18 acetylase RimI-like enzyme